MIQQHKLSLLVLSFAFLCSDNISGKLFADSTAYCTEDDEDYYDDPATTSQKKMPSDRPFQSQNQQKPMMRSDQMSNREMGQTDAMMGPVCCPEICEDCCYCDVCPPTDMITPLAGPCVMNGMGVYLTADFIYWTARERETAIAATTGFANSFQIGIPSTPKGKVVRFDQSYKPGFKVGLGLDFCHDGWDLFAEYTWYRLGTSKSVSAPTLPNTQLSSVATTGLTLWDAYWGLNGNNNVIGQNTSFDLVGGVVLFLPQAIVYGNASGKWRLHFNVVDLELGRNFYISRRLMLRPHFGLKGTWQKQNLSIALTNGISNFSSNLTFLPEHDRFMNQKLTEWGVGPRAGLDSAWHFSREFSLLGNIAVTGLYEHFSVDRFDYSLFPPSSPFAGLSNSFVNLESKFGTFQAVIEWMLGVRWEKWFLCDQYHFSLDAGWEEQIWFGQNQFLRVQNLESPEAILTLAGLTVHARFDF
ncbi:MAG TPA: Lpg1974 family pore-forming outer membrane protein [Rhabdochlamydiaceae bacterium]|nr:Lpg1974 family pore-forming outer membrane protein [Rhabdochlamydiaceae bacterium]